MNLPALGSLTEAVKSRTKLKHFLIGLDKRLLFVRSDHAALNTLLQSAGALIMKKALVLLDNSLIREHLYVPGNHYEFVANVHDEWQIEALPEVAETVGKVAAESIRLAGESFGLRCPLAGQFQIGKDWSETH
jgi:DNA polymerase I-like protein with 3'-5' exonuclease and polymerase domains